ncbi:MAG TPA: hypothetical protein DCR04_12935 [Flavobacteriales bacterium]|nr:hypothetical protein [Flavobacteriales bacterium]
MSFLRTVFLILLIGVLGVIIIGSESMTHLVISKYQLGWMVGLLLPKVLLLLASLALLIVCWPSLKKLENLKWVPSFLIIGLPIGLYLLVNVPYVNDWTKTGTELVGEGSNSIEVFLQETQPEFEGLICFALPGCEYCDLAISKLELLHHRNPNLDVLVFVFTKDSAVVNSYKNQSVGSSLTYLPVPNPNESIQLNNGNFPSFFYFKNGKLRYRWFSGEFGYPAFDWVESRLQ